MDMALTIFYQLIKLLGVGMVGWLLTKTGKITDEKTLSGYLANAALPALMLHSLQIPFSLSLLKDIGLAAAGHIAIFAAGTAVGVLLGRLARQSKGVTGTWTACLILPNSIYMGMPVMLALYGNQALPLAAGIIVSFNLASFLYGAWLLSLSSAQKKQASLKKLLLQPVILSVFAGIILFVSPFRLPSPAAGFLEMMGVTATPVAMLIIGSQLAKGGSLRDTFLDGKVYLVSLARLVPAGIAAHFIMRIFITDPLILGVLTICAFMPGAAILAVIATEQGGDALFCARMTFLSTLMCVVTAPIMLALLL